MGFAWADNYNSGSKTWVSDSVVDTVYILLRFAVGYGISALCSLIPDPFLATVAGIVASMTVDKIITVLVEDTGLLDKIKDWAAGVGEAIANFWQILIEAFKRAFLKFSSQTV